MNPQQPEPPRYPRGVPRANMRPGSPEWCYMTIDYAKVLYGSYETSLHQWEKVIQEIEEARVYERIPEGKPYGSLDALLRAEIGATADQSRVTVAERAESPMELGDHPGRCIDNNVINAPTRQGNNPDYLTARIARDFPEILERMKAGEFKSVRAAAKEAGIVRPTAQFYIDSPEDAARAIMKHIDNEMLASLVGILASNLRSRGDGFVELTHGKRILKEVFVDHGESKVRITVSLEPRNEGHVIVIESGPVAVQ